MGKINVETVAELVSVSLLKGILHDVLHAILDKRLETNSQN